MLEMGLEWMRCTAATWRVEIRLGVRGERGMLSESGEEVGEGWETGEGVASSTMVEDLRK